MHRVVMRTLAPERLLALLIAFVLAFGGASSFAAAEALFQVGVAKVDITPDYPIRLSGYGSRRTESDGVAQRIRAKALAISSDQDARYLFYYIPERWRPQPGVFDCAGCTARFPVR